MAGSVQRNDLMQRLNNVTRDDFIAMATKLGFNVTHLSSGSHYSIRRPGFAAEDFRGFVVTVYENMSRVVKGKVVKKLIESGIPETDIWKALGLL